MGGRGQRKTEQYQQEGERKEKMSILYELPGILARAEREYAMLIKDAKELPSAAIPKNCQGFFSVGDNARFMAEKIADGSLSGKIDLIYIDPPFFSETDQGARIEIKSPIYDKTVIRRIKAYKDTWGRNMADYLFMLAVRLMLMRDTLKNTGSIFVHLDWHAVHAVKLMMDEIFGENHFINEIIWTYKSGGAARRHFSRKHDTILFYAKTDRYKFRLGKEKSYNRGLKPYNFKGVEEFQDGVGWYTLVNQKDVWQIDMVGRSAAERLNYATQKPEALLERIIDATTEEGDLTADFFCGSGTLAAAALKTGRRFLCTDISSLAAANAMKRPLRQSCDFALKLNENLFLGWNAENAGDAGGPQTAAGVRVECNTAGQWKGNSIKAVRNEDEIHLLSYGNDKEKNDREPGLKWDAELLEILEKDPLSFVDYWGIGLIDKKEGICYPRTAVFRDRRGFLKTSVKIDIRSRDIRSREGADEMEMVIFAADIFGNIIFTQPTEC